jgi:arsenical pump membrane protein
VLSASLSQAWPPFVLVAGLLAIGFVAHREGVFEAAGKQLERLPGPPAALFIAGCLLVAVVTAVLNLDTAVVFVTPVIVLAARRRKLEEEPFVYAALFMANASSLYLPGSNLTNLLVLDRHPLGGGAFAAGFIAPALTATAVTAAGLLVIFGRRLRPAGDARTKRVQADQGVEQAPADHRLRRTGFRLAASARPGLLGALAAAVLTVILRQPAPEVAGVGVLVAGIALIRRHVNLKELLRAVSPAVLIAVFVVAVALGVLARAWHGPAQLLAHAGRPETAAVAALGSVFVNNLPAAVMLSAGAVPHPRALLIGLNLGPNLAVTGSLAAYLWMQAARQLEARTSWRAVTRRGALLAPAAIAAALLVSSH